MGHCIICLFFISFGHTLHVLPEEFDRYLELAKQSSSVTPDPTEQRGMLQLGSPLLNLVRFNLPNMAQ